MLRAVIFDFDGVITDSEILHLRAFNEVLGRYGLKISNQDYYKNYLELTDLNLIKSLVEQDALKLDEQGIKTLAAQKSTAYEKLARTEGRIIEGVRNFLQMLRSNNVPMAICSGSLQAEIEFILEEAGLRKFFDVIVSSEQVKRHKPYPDGFLLALRKLNETSKTAISAAECVAIEDSRLGLEAAHKAGMHCVAVTNSYNAEQLKRAEKIVDNISELKLSDLQKLCD
jgi:beta-phosphoglucomutase family hydrolase